MKLLWVPIPSLGRRSFCVEIITFAFIYWPDKFPKNEIQSESSSSSSLDSHMLCNRVHVCTHVCECCDNRCLLCFAVGWHRKHSTMRSIDFNTILLWTCNLPEWDFNECPLIPFDLSASDFPPDFIASI